MLNSPLRYTDYYGLDIRVCAYPGHGVNPFGHVGYGLPGESRTYGYYPGLPLPYNVYGPGVINPDSDSGGSQCKVVPANPNQDDCMWRCRLKRIIRPGFYGILGNQCTEFVRECMKDCGLNSGTYSGPLPWKFFNNLP